MPLSDHLRELRNRLAKSVLAILVCADRGGVLLQGHRRSLITEPIKEAVDCTVPFTELAKKDGGKLCGNITMSGLMGPFTLMIKVSHGRRRRGRPARSGSTSCGLSSRPVCTSTRSGTR